MRLFAELLAFFDDHANFSIISYGTAKVETGTVTPAAWKAWAETDGSGAVPFADNSWFVVQADKASATLNGDGSRQWQAKFQVTTTTGFDDCNVADVEHGSGTEGDLWSLFVRFSPDGSWVGSGTLDFVAVTASDNMYAADFGGGSPLGDYDFLLHVIGDDDTIIWVAQADDNPPVPALPNYDLQRFGYLGEMVRRSSAHAKPELAIIAPILRSGGYRLRKGSNEAASSVFSDPRYGGSAVPSFSLGADGSPVLRHMTWAAANNVSANDDLLWNGAPDPWTGDAEFIGIMIRQNHEEHNSLLGQLRLIEAAGEYVTEGNLWGDGTRLAVGDDTATRGGLAVPWPGSTTLPIF
jgi:hypothetical protein